MSEKITQKITALEQRLQELKQQQKKAEKVARAEEIQKQRKAEARQKIEIGGLAKIAGIHTLDHAVLMGAFQNLAELLTKQEYIDKWRARGTEILSTRKRGGSDAGGHHA